MEKEILDSSTSQDGVEIQNDSTNSQNTQVQADMVSKEEYLNAQSFGTKARQNEIAMATKLAQKDSSELHAISDSKVKDAVTKSLLGMSYAEATAVLGSNFDISSTSSDKPDDITSDSKIERELKLLRYKDEQREFDAALTKYQSQNPDLFKDSPEKMIELIKSEVVNISTSLPVEERIRRAATVSIGNPMDRQSLAYNLLLNGAAGHPKGNSSPQDEAKTKKETIQDEIRQLWGISKK